MLKYAPHFHCVASDEVFESVAAGRVIFGAATGLAVNGFAQVREQVRRRLIRTLVRYGPVVGANVPLQLLGRPRQLLHRLPWLEAILVRQPSPFFEDYVLLNATKMLFH